DLLRDPDPQVRLLALLALADLPADPAAGAAVVAALGDPANSKDRWIPDAATCAAARNSDHFLAALAAVKAPPPKLLGVAAPVPDHHARGGPVDTLPSLLGRLADADPAAAEAVVRGLARGWPRKLQPRLDAAAEAALERLAQRLPAGQRGQFL